MSATPRARLSLIYLVGYLVPAGLGLMIDPSTALGWLQSNGQYDDVFPRVAGMLLLGLALVVVQIIRIGDPRLIRTTVFIRAGFSVGFLGFYLWTRDPLFLVLLVIVAFGFLLTGFNLMLDHRSMKERSAS